MKIFKYVIFVFSVIALQMSCADDDENELSQVKPPSNLAILTELKPDNSGEVTITPSGESVVSFDVYFGDETVEPASVDIGNSVTHVYAEGVYEIRIVGKGITGLTTEFTQELEVSLSPPTNLMVTIENDTEVSKRVNITATADSATSYEVYSGIDGDDQPIVSNIGETVSIDYPEAGTYTIRVVAKGGATETIQSTEEFEVTALTAPTTAATAPPTRSEADVVSLFSESYTDVSIDTWRTEWSQADFEDVTIAGNAVKKYSALNFVGIESTSAPKDITQMTHIHLDIWTPDATVFKVKLVDFGADGVFGGDDTEHEIIINDPAQGEWVSIDVPLTNFVGLTTKSALAQYIFAAEPTSMATVYIDNLYFYKGESVATDPVEFPLDFESDTAPYAWGGFGGVDPASVIDNPDASGINTSNKVVSLQKNPGAEVWGGAAMILSGAVDFTPGTTVTMKVWSPRAGVPILFKMEDTSSAPDGNGNPSVFVEVQTSTTVANAWETLSFDLTSFGSFDVNISYQKVIIFPDFGTGGAMTGETFYFDDITLN